MRGSIPDSATLDGRPIEVKWEADGAVLSFEVEEPGDYRLELGFRPAQRVLGALGGFEMSIPRLAQSRLELTLPAEIPGIEAASRAGRGRPGNRSAPAFGRTRAEQ